MCDEVEYAYDGLALLGIGDGLLQPRCRQRLQRQRENNERKKTPSQNTNTGWNGSLLPRRSSATLSHVSTSVPAHSGA